MGGRDSYRPYKLFIFVYLMVLPRTRTPKCTPTESTLRLIFVPRRMADSQGVWVRATVVPVM